MKFSEYLDTLSREEIKELYKDLLKKNSTSFEEILKKLKELDPFKLKKCVVCGNELTYSQEPLILEFGKRGYRKKAFFCATDCLQYFTKTSLLEKKTLRITKHKISRKKTFLEKIKAIFS
ncbi:MAG TPA: hypothetical protein PLX15_04705 [Candidatus Woesearchaeota archaeon]|nr:hypothetical protein [Candidatus Woesearchaeota archaeon]